MAARLAPGAGALLVAVSLAGACQERPAPADHTSVETSPVTAVRALMVGDEAPAFSLLGSDGKQYTLSSYKGRQTVVLAWFSKAFTEG